MYLGKLIFAIFLITNLSFGLEKPNDFKIEDKLKIIIPKFKQNADITTVLESLGSSVKKHDQEQKGLKIIYIPFGDKPQKEKGKVFNFDFENMPVGEIIRYLCLSANLKYKIENNAVIIADPKVAIHHLETKFYALSSNLIPNINSNTKKDFKSYFESLGVQFPAGTKVAYIESASRLVVTNTAAEHKKVHEIIKALNSKNTSIQGQLKTIRHQFRKLSQEIDLLEKLVAAKNNKADGQREVAQKLKLILPKVRFEDRELDFVVDFLKRATKGLDPKKEGLNVIINVNKKLGKINLDADDIPVGEIVKYICEQLQLKYKLEKFALIISE